MINRITFYDSMLIDIQPHNWKLVNPVLHKSQIITLLNTTPTILRNCPFQAPTEVPSIL